MQPTDWPIDGWYKVNYSKGRVGVLNGIYQWVFDWLVGGTWVAGGMTAACRVMGEGLAADITGMLPMYIKRQPLKQLRIINC